MNEIKCYECGFIGRNFVSVGTHIAMRHSIGIKGYYDKWLSRDGSSKCIICGNNTRFLNLKNGYNICCSLHCTYILRKKTCIEKYGGIAPTCNNDVINKRRNNYFKNHGVYHQMHDDVIKNKVFSTNIKKYGNKCSLANKDIINKRTHTWNEKYGVDHIFKSDIIKNKIKKSVLLKYGSENVMQNPAIFKKQFINSHKIKEYRDSVYYQGTYEKDFLDKYFDVIEIKNGPKINYIFSGKNRSYYPDFLLPNMNLIVEIKSCYFYKRDGRIINKKRNACIKNGYSYILILDKNYKKFDKIISGD